MVDSFDIGRKLLQSPPVKELENRPAFGKVGAKNIGLMAQFFFGTRYSFQMVLFMYATQVAFLLSILAFLKLVWLKWFRTSSHD